MKEIAIIGAGIAGYGAAMRLNEANLNSVIYEKNNFIGGHCASFISEDGFIFDDGPHISFTKNEKIREIFARNVNNDFFEFKAYVNNFWQDKWIKHPAQCNLHKLPPDLNTKILSDLLSSINNSTGNISNYKQWLVASYGETFAENFPMKYTCKFHTTEAENMSIDWLGPRLYKPKVEEVIYGMLSPSTPDVHYVDLFRYPKYGGFVSFLSGLANIKNIEFKHELTKIDIKTKELCFNNNPKKRAHYQYLISSLPINKLVFLINNAPNDIVEAANKLAWTNCVLVNLGIKRKEISKAYWTYFYDEEYSFTRLSFPDKFSKNNAPNDCGSIQAEIYFSNKYKPLTKEPEDYIPIVINDLIKCGLLNEKDEIVHKNSRLIPYAQVIFDHERADSVKLIHEFLLDNDIYCCGRYGEWNYSWTDESFLSGEKAADKVINKS